jgi:type III restriction enzyme
MGLHPDFPPDPYAIMDPAVRWYPGDAMLDELGYQMLLPPLVHKVRQGVKASESGIRWCQRDHASAAEPLVNGEHPLPERARDPYAP